MSTMSFTLPVDQLIRWRGRDAWQESLVRVGVSAAWGTVVVLTLTSTSHLAEVELLLDEVLSALGTYWLSILVFG